MIPNSFIKVEQFPMTINRKIDKTFLKEIFKERNQNNLVSAADYNNLSDDEVQILKLVSKKLNISITKLDISKDFFENGGDSLSLFTFILDLEDYYGVSIPMDDIYGKKLYDLIRELKGNIKRKLHVEKTDNLLDMRNEDFYSKTEIKFLYDSYLRNTNKVISKFQAIHCQRIYYYDNYRNILTSTFEYKNCSIEKIKSVVQQVVASNSLLHSKISVDEKRMDFEIVKPNLDIPVLKVSNQSELTYLEDLLEDVGEDMIPTSRNQGGQLAMPIIISNGLNGKIIIQMDHSISDLSSISIIKKQIGRLVSGIEDTLTNDENYKYYYLDGQTINREKLLQEYEKDFDFSVFLISLKAGGVGINLISAQRIVIYDPWWNPAVEEQAIDRIYRIGQQKNVEVYKLYIKGKIEEKIYNLKITKNQIFKDLLEKQDSLLSLSEL